MEDFLSLQTLNGSVREIAFSLATAEEIRSSCANEDPMVHPHQLRSPFLGLPLESGRCEACGTSEQKECGGHFGQIVLPMPVYHPCHVHELKNILNLLCLNCLRMKKGKVSHGFEKRKRGSPCFHCPDLPTITVSEVKTVDGAIGLELKAITRNAFEEGFWSFLRRYGFRYGDTYHRPLLPYEALNILKEIPEFTIKKLASKGFYPQKGLIMQSLSVPPNCLHSSDYIEGKNMISFDISLSSLRRILKKLEDIRKSRSGFPSFECCKFESDELQAAILQYMRLRGTNKQPQDVTRRFMRSEASKASTKKWLEKIRTLFIRKSSGFSSRSVITGDAYMGVDRIGIPSEIAAKVTFEERVTAHNIRWLQEIVDSNQCVTFTDGLVAYEVAPRAKGRHFLKVGQIVRRQVIDGDMVFINRPPSTHAHSIQALSVYLHDDLAVKINPLICSPLGADFDGDCIPVFYPQSFLSKSEARELFSVDQQFLSSHSGMLNLQLAQDSLLALKLMKGTYFLKKSTSQQLAMFSSPVLPFPALYKTSKEGSFWTVTQLLQGILPPILDCRGKMHLIRQGEIMLLNFTRDSLKSTMTEVVASILGSEGPKQALKFFNLIQPFLMEFISLQGFSISLKDFNVPKDIRNRLKRNIERSFPFLCQLRRTNNEIIFSRVESHLEGMKTPVKNVIKKQSSLGSLVDLKSDSAVSKLVQQLGFIGLQLSDQGKLYSPAVVHDIYSHFTIKYQLDDFHCPTKGYGLIGSSFIQGLDPFEELIHSIESREQILRSSSGLTEPGTLFKNLMSILRDVVLVYDGTVRNLCTNSILMFGYRSNADTSAGKPVGILAATAISNPAYKAVQDSSQSMLSSWEMMKEVLLSKVRLKNDDASRRVILYMNNCLCGRSNCQEAATSTVCSFLKKVNLRDCAVDFSIEYQKQIMLPETNEAFVGLVAHIHLDHLKLDGLDCKLDDICRKCLDAIHSYGIKRKNLSQRLKKIFLYSSECCNWDPHKGCNQSSSSPCLWFLYHDPNAHHEDMKETIDIMAQVVCPLLLDTIIKGDPRVHSTKIIWISPDTIHRVESSAKNPAGELAVEITIEKDVAKQNGDTWRVALDCCLPVMDLIDTKRTTPHNIQQIQDFLGISAAFNQSFQRLSKAVGHVSKGVLKEHLLLVTQCLTYSGRVSGYYTAGFKSLFRSLDVQVPFTEATLHAPLKCFERAAEKRHVDSLTSVVAGCSWGKRVTIGTGGQFEILWDTKKMAEAEDGDSDIYSFLNMVKDASGQQEKGSALLGVDVDYLPEDDVVPSPLHDAKFWEFDIDKGIDSENEKFARMSDGWEKQSNCGDQSGQSNARGHKNSSDVADWSQAGSCLTQWGGQKETQESILAWGVNDVDQESNYSRSKTSPRGREESQTVSQGASQNQGELPTWGRNIGDLDQNREPPAWGRNTVDFDQNQGEPPAWGMNTVDLDQNQGESPAWGRNTAYLEQNRGEPPIQGRNTIDLDQNKGEPPRWGRNTVDPDHNQGESPAWGRNTVDLEQNQEESPAWGRNTVDLDQNKGESPTWGRNIVDLEQNQGESPAWGRNTVDLEQNQEESLAWGKNTVDLEQNQGELTVWGANTIDLDQNQGESPASGRNTVDLDQSDSSGRLESQSQVYDIEWNQSQPLSQLQSQMGKPERRLYNHRGLLNSSDPRGNEIQRRQDSPRNRESTRRPPVKFTPEEEMILVDIDPVMRQIRRILHLSGYNLGDRLSAEDQSYVLDNAFRYHPNRSSKISGEVDHVTIDQPEGFPSTRCFFVVSSDGMRVDFSFIKCMANFVRERYPDIAESFCNRFFKPRHITASKDQLSLPPP